MIFSLTCCYTFAYSFVKGKSVVVSWCAFNQGYFVVIDVVVGLKYHTTLGYVCIIHIPTSL